MNDRDYLLRVMQRTKVGPKRADADELRTFVRGCIRGAVTVENAAELWHRMKAAEEERRQRPGDGLGDWTDDWLDCERCGLCDTRKRVVFGRGELVADVLLIGDAPSVEDDAAGLPFQGPPGELLARPLRIFDTAGVSYYLTNLVGCRAPDGVLAETEIAACRRRLDATVRDVQPWVVVLLGASRSPGEHGHWGRHGYVSTIPTWHPAAILRDRDPVKMRELRDDFRYAVTLVTAYRAVLF